MPQPHDTALPAWLEPLRRAALGMTIEDLAGFSAPEGATTRAGAVLMLFGEGDQGPDLVLTERAHGMRSHPGQVSFPGGSVDAGDADAAHTALREAQEEIGLDPSGVHVFGVLPQMWLLPSNFTVTPVLGWWHTPSDVHAVDPAEVHAVYRVPVAELLDPAHRVSVRHPSGWTGPAFLIGGNKDLVLWGFTAGIVSRLLDFLGWTRPWDATVMRDLPEHMLAARRGAPSPPVTAVPTDP